MNKPYDALVFCGRFQPFHNGHKAVIDRALTLAEEVVVVVGSSFQPRSINNPFTFSERKLMIKTQYPGKQVKVIPVSDYPYDDTAWVGAVQNAVTGALTSSWTDFPKKIGLIGHSKDSSSYYLKIFPQWRNHVEVENVDNINATYIRNKLFDYKGTTKYFYSIMPAASAKIMEQLVYSDEYGSLFTDFSNLADEYEYIRQYRKSWDVAPYEPTFITTDAVLTQSGYVLLIKRGGFPYKDCWALPGGYLEKNHFITDNMIKELREETGVRIPAKVLKGSIKGSQVFDHPNRDPRGRTITHAFWIDLGFPDEKLPRVKGADDAKEAKWFLLSDLHSEMMAFDHYHIIKRFIPSYNP